MQNELKRFLWLSLCVLTFAFCVSLTGCTAVGVLAYKFTGPPKVEAKYVPKQVPLAVLSENRHRSVTSGGPEVLTEFLVEQLTENKVAPIVPPEKLQELHDQKLGGFYAMSVSSIGKIVGAEQVLYVQFDRDEISPLNGGEGFQGRAEVRVKIIDVNSGATLWPTDQTQGYPASASITFGHQGTHGTINDVHRRIYASLADQIAKYFYKWQPEDSRPGE